MKRFLALALAIAMMCSLFCACGKKTSGSVTTTVPAKYDDGFAGKYAASTKTDKDGNTVYEFTGDQYDRFTQSYNNHLSAEMSSKIIEQHNSGSTGDQVPYGQYVYINEEKKAVIVGLMPGQYNEAVAKEEADIAAEYGFKYFQSIEKPVDSFKVLYVNANDQEEIYGTFDYSVK